METIIFSFSRNKLVKIKKTLMTMRILSPIVLLIYITFIHQHEYIGTHIKLFSFLFTLTIVEIILYFMPKWMLNRMVKKTVSIDQSRIKLYDGKYTKSITLREIKRIQVIKNEKKNIINLKVYSPGQSVSIDNINGLSEFFSSIEPFLSDNTDIINKSTNSVWKSPLFVVFIALLTAIAIIFLVNAEGEKKFYFFYGILVSFLGIIGIFFKPVSKQLGQMFRKAELIISNLLILSGVANILFLFFKI